MTIDETQTKDSDSFRIPFNISSADESDFCRVPKPKPKKSASKKFKKIDEAAEIMENDDPFHIKNEDLGRDPVFYELARAYTRLLI